MIEKKKCILLSLLLICGQSLAAQVKSIRVSSFSNYIGQISVKAQDSESTVELINTGSNDVDGVYKLSNLTLLNYIAQAKRDIIDIRLIELDVDTRVIHGITFE